MKYVDEFRDSEQARNIAQNIRALVKQLGIPKKNLCSLWKSVAGIHTPFFAMG